jgi:cell division septum initiation protein DivIVA
MVLASEYDKVVKENEELKKMINDLSNDIKAKSNITNNPPLSLIEKNEIELLKIEFRKLKKEFRDLKWECEILMD